MQLFPIETIDCLLLFLLLPLHSFHCFLRWLSHLVKRQIAQLACSLAAESAEQLSSAFAKLSWQLAAVDVVILIILILHTVIIIIIIIHFPFGELSLSLFSFF